LVATTTRQALVIVVLLLLSASGVGWSAVRSKDRDVDAGFWFELVAFDASEPMAARLGGPLSPDEISTIGSVARSELTRAFAPFRVRFTASRNATYRMRVVQSLRLPVYPKAPPPSAESRAITGIGGQGAVNFQLLANSAIAYSPEEASREEMIMAIGRGIGRAAAHEFAHQFLGPAPIHNSRDVGSYEYRSADRREQYYGDMRWDIAGPLLEKRLGRSRR
jgi:hypothetical protein